MMMKGPRSTQANRGESAPEALAGSGAKSATLQVAGEGLEGPAVGLGAASQETLVSLGMTSVAGILEIGSESCEAEEPEAMPAFTLADRKALVSRILNGAISPEELREAFAAFKASIPAIKAELAGVKKGDILKMLDPMSAYRLKGERKDRIVESAVDNLARGFLPGRSMEWSPMSETMFQAIERSLSKVTVETIQAFADDVAQARQNRREEIEATLKAVKDPVTLEDFQTFERLKGRDSLSIEQKARFDDLLAEKQREKGQAAILAPLTVVETVTVGPLSMDLHATRHTKTGEPIWVVSLDQRVERETYDELNSKAKQLGGWYSSYRGNGAIPGFTFKNEETARSFMAFREGDVAKPISLEEPKVEKAARVSSKLTEMAQQMKEQATDDMNQPRKTHTHRYASMADRAERGARAKLAMAQTMENLADAIQSGRAKHLAGITNRVQIETLDELLVSAVWNHMGAREKAGERFDWNEAKNEPPTLQTVEHAQFPYPVMGVQELRRLISSAARIGQGITRTRGRLEKLASQAEARGEDAKIVFDSDERLELLSAAAQKLSGCSETKYEGELTTDRLAPLRRLHSAGIDTPEQFRAALREYLVYRGINPGEDPIKAAERALVGVKIPGYFPTPLDLAEMVIAKASIRPGMTVLEPSAGKGSLIDTIKATHGEDVLVEAIEPNFSLRTILEAKGYKTVASDVFDHAGEYDRVVMNPPFEDGQDMDHVQKAFDLLKPGGRLVAIVSEGPFFRDDRKTVAWRSWFNDLGGESERNAEGSFKSSDRPTGVATRTIILDRRLNTKRPSTMEEGRP